MSLTSLVGRGREIADLRRLLGQARLITLTGAGGVGNTRLAVAVATELREGFEDGAPFVDLSVITHPDGVPLAIARGLSIRDAGELPLMERLINALRDRRLLLILDNFEHVLEQATLVLTLLQALPRLSVLVTSRAPLRVRGEREFPVLPLACPTTTSTGTLDQATHYSALELFTLRAQDVRPEFRLTHGNVDCVAEICRRLDGLPLAIELAAARIRVLPPEAMLGRLDDGLSLLSGGARDLPPRQRTMGATITWSYNLLNPADQHVLRRLAVFNADFGLAAAIAVAGCSAQPLDVLSSLVEKNLLQHVGAQRSEPRFRLLETVREFGRAQLHQHGELEDAQRSHADFFGALLDEAASWLRGAAREQWMQRIDAEMDNIRAAVDWSLRMDGGATLVRYVCALGFFYWRIRGNLHEGLRWCQAALESPAGEDQRACLLWTAGGLAAYMGRLPVARAWLEEAMRLARSSTDLGYALLLLGFVESHLGDPLTVAHLREGISVLRQAGAPEDLLLGMDVAIAPYASIGDLAAARATLGECLALARTLGDDWARAVALSSAGYMEVSHKEWSAALLHMQAALPIFERFGDEGSIAIILNNMGVVCQNTGDTPGAIDLFQKSLATHRRLGLNHDVTLRHLEELQPQVSQTAESALSARELEVLKMIAGGNSNREIADALVISPNTVARHVSNIFDKLGAANRTEAAAYAYRHQITSSC